jgi:carbamate kinase
MPREILELGAIRELVARGYVVIAVGGGGIPVVRDANGDLRGTAAVIDKDLASALLAAQLGAEVFIISTGVDRVCLDYGKPTQRALSELTLAEARRYLADGQFPAGSMGPKVEAVAQFLAAGGKRAIITSPEHLAEAVEGKHGTHIRP